MKTFWYSLVLSWVVFAGGSVRADTVLFEQNFDGAPVGALPKDFLALAGEFTVVKDGAGQVLELPGSPLDTYGALFGPSHGEAGTVQGRFYGTKQGRKFPTFGVSLRGAGGYRLQVSPGKGQLEIYKGDEALVGVPYQWESGSWVWLRLGLRKEGASWVAEGRVWKEGGEAPQMPTIRWEVVGEPSPGRAAIWGSPYAGTPIRFDDLRWTTP